MSESTRIRPADDRPLVVRYVAEALREWPPLSSVELVGVASTTTFVGVHMDLIETEYYPFDVVQQMLEEANLDAEICGLDTTPETDRPRLILSLSHTVEIVTANAIVDQ